LKVSYRWDF